MSRFFYSFLVSMLFMYACTSNKNSDEEFINASEIREHIAFLASDALKGREAGTQYEAIAANYIADQFRDYGLEPAGEGKTYFQTFTINTALLQNPHATKNDSSEEKRMARNVAALLQGTDNSDKLIILGAHYDHLGMGEFGSLGSRGPKIHNGADDNASGIAGLLELAEYFAANRPQKDILFLAFSGEEMGLLGSQYFVDHPTVDLSDALAMINMDMIGRMNDGKLIIFGAGTSEGWEEILKTSNTDSLELNLIPDGTGASDHTSFYYKDIPVLHYFTDTHADYHRPSDDAEYINYEGEADILESIVRVVSSLDTLEKKELAFTAAPGKQRQSVTMSGPTLGVLPDYGYDGKGMKITGVSEDRPAEKAGLKGGDIIIKIADMELEDIYAYMDALNSLEKGQKTTITVIRDGEEVTLPLQL